ncbi:MAG: protein kinase [Vicinamibacterales bacterium]
MTGRRTGGIPVAAYGAMTQDSLENRTLSHYRILSRLGAGGMGEVWLAEDTRLGRRVALKLLPADFTKDEARVRRFMQEAKAASALNHPNIVSVYDIGESDAGMFIVMELVTGRTLRAVVGGNSSVDEIRALGTQIARALTIAHAAGITHRDIKPDNIMVRDDGYVKVLDFGLARLRSSTESDSDPLTQATQTTPGMLMGTVAYMSPEQVRGEPAGPPSDVFALGILLYELTAGRHPFQSDTLVGYLHAITTQDPVSVGQLRPQSPRWLNALIERMLSKDASLRPTASEVEERLRRGSDAQHDEDLGSLQSERAGILPRSTEGLASLSQAAVAAPRVGSETLVAANGNATSARRESLADTDSPRPSEKRRKWKWWVARAALLLLVGGGILFYRSLGRVQAPIDSLAVLPFENRSATADSEYLSDGLAETLIYRLSQLPNLKVSPTSSVARYRGQAVDPRTVARDLGVRAVMTGRVAQRDDNLVISVELVDVVGNKTLWGERYERRLADLLAIQREMSSEIAERLELKLSGEGQQKLAKRYTTSSEAYQLYLQGRYHWGKRTKDEILRAIDYYRRAIAIDPDYALAYSGIADAYNSMGKDPDLAPKDAIPPAKDAALRALAIDPELAEAHAALGDSYAIYDWNWTESEREFQRAIALDPNVSYVRLAHGSSYLAAVGRPDDAVTEIARALELEPLSPITNSVLVTGYLYARQNDKALQQGRKAFELEPEFLIARHWLGLAYVANGMYADAISIAEGGLQRSPSHPEMLFVIGYAHAKQGHRREAEEIVTRLSDLGQSRYVRTYWTACIYAALGDPEKAFAALERSFVDRDVFLPRANSDPMMDPLRTDPRFASLLARMHLGS